MTQARRGGQRLQVGERSPAAMRPVRRQTVTDSTVDAIREMILTGQCPEGASLPQDALAEALGVSRIPVREALRQLESEGLVTLSPHVGAVVSTLSLDEIKELFELRALIEGDLMRRAVPVMGEEDVAQAAEILDRYELALKQGDVSAWGELNWEFHRTLYAPARQPLTMGVVQNLHNHSDRYLRMQLSLTHGENRADEEHRAILRAAEEREAEHARSLLSSHILGACRSLVDFLREHRDGSG